MFFDPAYQSLKNGLVGYWSPVATGPTGLQLLDLSGQNNHGTLNGMDAPTDWVDSPYGRVLDFDGTDDYVSQASLPVYAASNLRTWACWCYSRAFDGQSQANDMFGRDRIGIQRDWLMGAYDANNNDSNASLAMNLWGTSGGNLTVFTTTEALVIDRWQLAVATYNGSGAASGIQLYIDGVNYAVDSSFTGGTYGSDSATSNELWIGVRPGRNNQDLFWNGRIGEVAMWNRGLTASEVQTLYNLGPGKLLRSKPTGGPSKRKWWPGVKTPKSRPIIPTQRGIKSGPIFYDPKASWFRNGLVGHWCPSATSPTGTQLLDLSGGNNNGTLTNMPVSTSWVTNGGKGALSFSASNSYVATTKTGASGSEPRAGFAWINTSVAGGAIIEWGANTATQRWQFGIVNTTQYGNTIGQLWVENWGTLRSAGPTVNDGNWHHVGYSYTGGNLNTTLLWIDGISYVANQGTLGTGVVNTATTSPITIGYSLTSASVPFNGVIDDVRVYNRAVTAGEVAKLYAGGRGYGVSSKPYRRSSYSPAPKKIFKSRIDRKRSLSLVHPDQDNQWITNGLVGFWCPSLTGATGTQLLDLSGQNNNGVLTNMDAPTDWVDSGQGLALDFDGVNDFVDCGIIRSFPQNNWTISAWAMTRLSSQRGIIATGTNTGTRTQIHMFFFNSTTLAFRLVNDDQDISGLPNMLNQMQHVVWTFDGSNFGTFYLNGTRIGSKQYSGPFIGTTDFFLGRGQGATNRLLDGQIASSSLYNRALTPSEIQTLYQLGPRMGFSRSPSRSPTWMVEADETIGNRRRRIICGGKN